MKKYILAALIIFPIAANASWGFEQQEDAFDEANNRYLAYTISTSDDVTQLMVICMDNTLSIRVGIATHLDLYGVKVMKYRYRIDKREIVEDDDAVNKSGQLVLMGNSMEPMLTGLRSGNVISIELNEPNERSVRHTFSLTGSSAQISKAVAACSK